MTDSIASTQNNTAAGYADLNPEAQNPAIDTASLEFDKALHALVSKIDILDAVKPLNYLEQKQQFFKCLYSTGPDFVYQRNAIDPFFLKRSLFNLPLEDLNDEDLVNLYKSVIDSYVDKIDQFKSIGSNEFLYDSLRYYGEPSDKDVKNAQFILHLPESLAEENEPTLDADAIVEVLSDMVAKENYTWEIVIDETMIANALVSGTRVRVNKNARLTRTDTLALAHHELGVHLATSLNGRQQPLRIMSLGCHLNTTTQEGMAILAEYLAGHLTIKRLKVLALRVMAVKSMIEDKSFRRTFLMLKEDYQTSDELAFTITARAYRGGGFTKDYLYLKGFRLILNAYEQEPNFNNLLIGKASLDALPIITRLVEKGILLPPGFITPAFKNPVQNDDVRAFVTHAIR